jgi:hypothetical protein
MFARQEIIYSIRLIVVDLIRQLVYFPIWWYSAGLALAVKFLGRGIKIGNQRLAIKILFKYWFKPMYGQTDWQGKIISFFMRTVLLIWRLFLFLCWLVALVVIFLTYLSLPIFTIYQIVKF